MSDDDGVLARWSRRKLAARGAGVPQSATQAPAEPPESTPQAEIPADCGLQLPDIATLDAGSDFTPFMRSTVPAGLRRTALRKLWRVNPIINSLDGLDDYYVTADFTDAATVVADLRTAYRVGRGLLTGAEASPGDEPAGEAASMDTADLAGGRRSDDPPGTASPSPDPGTAEQKPDAGQACSSSDTVLS